MSELDPDDVADVVQQIADVEGAILQHEEVDYTDSHPIVTLEIGVYDTDEYGDGADKSEQRDIEQCEIEEIEWSIQINPDEVRRGTSDE